MPSPILARADALMHRRRPSPGEGEDVPLLTEAIPLPPEAVASTTLSPPEADPDDSDDIPVLLDMESDIEAAAAIPVVDHAKPGGLIDQLHAALDRELHPEPVAPAPAQARTQGSMPSPTSAAHAASPTVSAAATSAAQLSAAAPAPARQRAAPPPAASEPPELSTAALIELSRRIEQRLSALLPALIAETLNDYLQEQAERPPR
jgi:hypothetical protein